MSKPPRIESSRVAETFGKTAAGTFAASMLLAALASYIAAAPTPPDPSTHISGYYWKRGAVLVSAGSGTVRSVDVESAPASVPSVFTAIGRTDTVEVYSYAKLSAMAPPTWNKEATLNGAYVSLSSTRLAIGSPTPGGGSVQVYQRSSRGAWNPMGPALTPSVTSGLAMQFGRPVVLDGGVLVVGSPSFDFQGRAFVFELQSGQWIESAVLGDDFAGQAVDESLLGAAVSVAGDFIAVGQTPDDAPGKVYIYQKQAGTWVHTETVQARNPDDPSQLAAPGDSAAEVFGKAIVMSGTHLAVRSNGYVQLFERSLSGSGWVWNFSESFAVGSSGSSFYHRPLAFDGSSLLTGEPWSPAIDSMPPGRARPLLGPSAIPFVQFQSPISSNPDKYLIKDDPETDNAEFGRTMAIDGGWLVIGDKQHVRVHQKTVY